MKTNNLLFITIKVCIINGLSMHLYLCDFLNSISINIFFNKFNFSRILII